ncbi:hypothetical protein RIEPE_0165 [Candidatus Riesia pediculicola USDA]|uniref:Uncharacterized protein n=1 Tax=Riesia pediculicola (strain USDA) TaxID=515618 RepID=D4G7X3_RIEPU|nr:hypothetical protein RIEPE_0165 [Candidatus Riesia pediculicola USDA]
MTCPCSNELSKKFCNCAKTFEKFLIVNKFLSEKMRNQFDRMNSTK